MEKRTVSKWPLLPDIVAFRQILLASKHSSLAMMLIGLQAASYPPSHVNHELAACPAELVHVHDTYFCRYSFRLPPLAQRVKLGAKREVEKRKLTAAWCSFSSVR
eukprot:3098991-Amphidinium_carterae.1